MILLVALDIALVVVVSIAVGASAPRWPARWLSADPVPLRLMRWETAAGYRRIGVPALAHRLPELGTVFGGQSKAALPGTQVPDLMIYLVEVRRAEWVHWASVASTFALFAFNPWWLALAFVVAVTLGNLPFILILRNNRRKIGAIVAREENRT